MSRVSLPEFCYEGYIFDLDGTLVDSMHTHFRAWRSALAHAGAPPEVFRSREFVSYGGRAAIDIIGALNVKYGLHMDAQATSQYKKDYYLQLLRSEPLAAIAEVLDFVRELKRRGLPCAIGTGSAPKGAAETLRSAGMSELFDLIVTPEDVPAGRGKPCPDIFLLCAQRMGVNPQRCIVFEDAQPGIDAAMSAGMDYAVVAEPDMSQWDD